MLEMDGEAGWSTLLRTPHSRWKGVETHPNFPETAVSRLNEQIFSPRLRVEPLPRESRFFTIGSCFARNIEGALTNEGLTVLSGNAEEILKLKNLSERININEIFNKFNAPSMFYEFSNALDNSFNFPADSFVEISENNFSDLNLISALPSESLDTIRDIRDLIMRSFRKVKDANVVIITLGLAEAWYDRQTGLYLNDTPSRNLVRKEKSRFIFKVLGYEENFRFVENMISLLRNHCEFLERIILTVSPVPFAATFSGQDVVVANSYSKSVLRSVAQAASAAHDILEYYPSYEMVLNSDPAFAWQGDRMHVRDEMVRSIMSHFKASYLPGAVGQVASAPPPSVPQPLAPQPLALPKQPAVVTALPNFDVWQTRSNMMSALDQILERLKPTANTRGLIRIPDVLARQCVGPETRSAILAVAGDFGLGEPPGVFLGLIEGVIATPSTFSNGEAPVLQVAAADDRVGCVLVNLVSTYALAAKITVRRKIFNRVLPPDNDRLLKRVTIAEKATGMTAPLPMDEGQAIFLRPGDAISFDYDQFPNLSTMLLSVAVHSYPSGLPALPCSIKSR